MGYMLSIKTALFIFPFISFLFTIPFILRWYHKYGSIHPLRVIVVYSFIFYLLTIYFLVILPLPDRNEVLKPTSSMMRLVPFTFVSDFLKETSLNITQPTTYIKSLMESCFYVVLFNILMTIPFGMYLRYYFKYSFKKTFIITFLLSLFFEVTQLTGLYFIYPYPYRLFDVDDLILNTLGGLLGYFLMGVVRKYLPTREFIDKNSLEIGREVSPLRRITVFFLDVFLYICFVLIGFLFFHYKYTWLVIFVIYYIFYPFIKNGKTLGSGFLNVRVQYPKMKLLFITTRILFLYFYYFFSFYIILRVVTFIKDFFNLGTGFSILIYLGVVFFSFGFYVVNFIGLFVSKEMFYDVFFQTKFLSTIGEDVY